MATNDEVANHLGISPTRVSQLKSAGILPEARRRANNLTACRRAYLEHLREVAAGRGSKDGTVDLVAERARLTKAQAAKAERENAVAEGEFLPRCEVHTAMTATLMRVRSKLLAMPSKLAPYLVGIETPATAQEILKVEIYRALDELAGTKIIDGEFVDDPGDDPEAD